MISTGKSFKIGLTYALGNIPNFSGKRAFNM